MLLKDFFNSFEFNKHFIFWPASKIFWSKLMLEHLKQDLSDTVSETTNVLDRA